MIIKRRIETEGNLKPEVYNLLNNLPYEVLHHKRYGYLHPLGIYNRSLSRIFHNFNRVLTQISEVYKEIQSIEPHNLDISDFNSGTLLETQSELLHSLQSHIDDCFHILIATSHYPDMSQINSKRKKAMDRSASQWLYITKHPTFHYFKNNIQEYKTFIDVIVNTLKHRHGRLCDILMINDYAKRLGYYVETSGVGSDDEVFVGPDVNIHPDNTGFSYSRDLSFHFYNLYEISHHLKNALLMSFKKQYGIQLEDNFYFEEVDVGLNDVAQRICELNLQFFPKEYPKPVPMIEWNNEHNNTLILSLDKNFHLNSDFFGPIRTIASWTADGTTKTFRLPIG